MLSRIFSILVIKNLLNTFTSSKRDPEGSLVFSFRFMRSLMTSNSNSSIFIHSEKIKKILEKFDPTTNKPMFNPIHLIKLIFIA